MASDEDATLLQAAWEEAQGMTNRELVFARVDYWNASKNTHDTALAQRYKRIGEVFAGELRRRLAEPYDPN